MTTFEPENLPPAPPETVPARPWSAREAWLGLALMALLTLGGGALTAFARESLLFQTIGLVGLELIYALPALALVLWRKVPWADLGLKTFPATSLALGCGLMLGGYVIILIHNLLLMAFKLQTQGLEILELFNQLKSPVGLVLAGVLVAPFSEELFFRGFLFGGLETRYGWKKAALVSSLLFAIFHLNLPSLVPTFILGGIFAVMYHQSKSIWPGIFLHFLMNAFSLCSLLALSQLPRP
jgi:membrane protease YdiL (CAAX protease family)